MLICGIDIGENHHEASIIDETIRIGRFSTTELADEDILSMRQLCRHRMDLVDYISDQKRKIISVMDRVFPEYQTLFSDMFGKTSTELLNKAITPEEILAIPTDELSNLLKSSSRGRLVLLKPKKFKNSQRHHLVSQSARLLLACNFVNSLR